uniref:Uncharacterized protein n=1 Tax=Hyaloperonospora arabidopsidis (strain Emoy2) TaxID=559515 RepID=M4BQR6_HYAAE
MWIFSHKEGCGCRSAFDFVTEDPLNPDDVARSTALYIGAVASRVIRKLHCTTVYGHSRRRHPAVDRAVVDSAKIQWRSDLMMTAMFGFGSWRYCNDTVVSMVKIHRLPLPRQPRRLTTRLFPLRWPPRPWTYLLRHPTLAPYNRPCTIFRLSWRHIHAV